MFHIDVSHHWFVSVIPLGYNFLFEVIIARSGKYVKMFSIKRVEVVSYETSVVEG